MCRTAEQHHGPQKKSPKKEMEATIGLNLPTIYINICMYIYIYMYVYICIYIKQLAVQVYMCTCYRCLQADRLATGIGILRHTNGQLLLKCVDRAMSVRHGRSLTTDFEMCVPVDGRM